MNNAAIIHPQSGSFLMFVIGASVKMASGVWRSKHALLCVQHPAPLTISSADGRYDIIEP